MATEIEVSMQESVDKLFHTEKEFIHHHCGVRKFTQHPSTSGSSVIGLTFDGGVIIAADMLGSYGSLARFRTCERVMKVNDTTALGAGGDYADYQYLTSVIEQKIIDEECLDDGFNIKPKSLYCWLTRVLYNRRSKFDPLWNTFLIGGMQDGKPFLGHIDKIGTAYEAPVIATGFGTHIALPLLRDEYEKNDKMTEDQAKKVIMDCMRLLYYRDCRSSPKFQVVVVTSAGSKVEGPLVTDTNWEIGLNVDEY